MTEATDDAPNVLTLCVLVLLTCTAPGNSGNGVSSVIVMVLVAECIGYDQKSSLLLQSVDTTEYPHMSTVFPRAGDDGGSDKNRRGSTGKRPRFFTYTYLSN